jgi:hypothetical protein
LVAVVVVVATDKITCQTKLEKMVALVVVLLDV